MCSGLVTVRYKIAPIKNSKYSNCALYKPKEKQSRKLEKIQKAKPGTGLSWP